MVTLRDVKDALGTRQLWATLESGDVVIQGVDRGKGVSQVFGDGVTEYEWAWTIRAAHVPALLQALGGGTDVLASLQRRFDGDRSSELGAFLSERGIPFESWSRTGD